MSLERIEPETFNLRAQTLCPYHRIFVKSLCPRVHTKNKTALFLFRTIYVTALKIIASFGPVDHFLYIVEWKHLMLVETFTGNQILNDTFIISTKD